MTGSRKFFVISTIGMALAGLIAIASPAFADSVRCNDRGCRAYVSHRTINRAAAAARDAANFVDTDDAANAAAWAHYFHEHLDN